MKGYSVYNEIMQLKELGFKKAQVASQLEINRRTVDRYWNMSVDDYQSMLSSVRRKQALDEYRDTIIGWLKEFPKVSASQITDWLKEDYSAFFKGRTVSRYVKELRETLDLPKEKEEDRDYEAVPELPYGKQVQVDFGQKIMRTPQGGSKRVFFAAFLLSRSRHGYAEGQGRPFTSSDLVAISRRCFEFFGGVPLEMVFDQDSIVTVSENAGDIIYTYEFEKFRQEYDLKIYLCRKSDPESKGKIENMVKYIKGNFLSNRLYVDDETLNISCLKWLERTANARVHGTTKKIPAEEFLIEQNYLRPLPKASLPEVKDDERSVRKDNTIIYKSNRYSLPLGTYHKTRIVRISTDDNVLTIKSPEGEVICEHRISASRGVLIQNTDHTRDKTTGINKYQKKLDLMLEYHASDFLSNIRLTKTRYARDQFSIIEKLIDIYGVHSVIEGTDFCTRNQLYSANILREYLESKVSEGKEEPILPDISRIPIDDPVYHVKTEKRPLDVYSKVGGDDHADLH